MNLHKLIPKHKSDFSTMEELKRLSNEDFKEIGMEILEWFQDINWCIAGDIRDLIVQKQDVMIEHILIVLNGYDEWWKYWIVTNILPELSEGNIKMLLPKLMSIYYSPTPSEIEVEVYDEVVNFLHDEKYKNNKGEIINFVIDLWSKGKLPCINGILLSDGRIYSNIRSLENKNNKEAIYNYLVDVNKYSDFYDYINILSEDQYKGYKIFCGDTSHESYGYTLVLSEKDEFEWLLFDKINPIEKFIVRDNVIYATNNCSEEFVLPIYNPESFKIISKN